MVSFSAFSTPRRWVVLTACGLGACSSTPKLQGPGGACTSVTDCEKGLVCVSPPKGRCASDLSSTVGTEGAPASEGGASGDAPAE
jgi:hypothetical protein